MWQGFQDNFYIEDTSASTQQRPPIRVWFVPQGIPLAGRPQTSLPLTHQAATVLLSLLLLQGQTEVPGGEAFKETPPRDVSRPGRGEGFWGSESDTERCFAGDSGWERSKSRRNRL